MNLSFSTSGNSDVRISLRNWALSGSSQPNKNLKMAVVPRGNQASDSQKHGLLWRWWKSRVGMYSVLGPGEIIAF